MTEIATAPMPVREAVHSRRIPDPCAMVIFGASGDLTERKLVPALYYLARQQLLPAGFSVLGCARTSYTEDQFRDKMRRAITKFLGLPEGDDPLLESFLKGIFYLADDFGQAPAYGRLSAKLEELDRERGTKGSRLFYLSTPPSFFPVTVKLLGAAGLARPKDPESGWTRIIIEKPFGRDLQSARELTQVVTSVFEENQVYRIDHYVGKETVQNLVVFRFANGIYEPIWNRRYIDHVQITVAEDLGIENRGSYYEEAGLTRDMIQNHVLQLLALVAMEPPSRFEAHEVRDEKAKVMRSMRPIPIERLSEFAVRGQYVQGSVGGITLPAYRAEPKVSPNSTRETYTALKVMIDNWRWADVPFYLRSGKRLPKRVSEISLQFRRVPHMMFQNSLTEEIEPNLLSVRLQPDEGIATWFSAKLPGATMQIRPVKMEFCYGKTFGAPPPTAYETLLLDCMLGDGTLFTRADAVELAWALVDPVLARWQEQGAKGLAFHEAGSWGPAEADAFIERDGRRWQNL